MPSPRSLRRRRPARALGAVVIVVAVLGGCSSDDTRGGRGAATAANGAFDASFVHDISVSYDQQAYDAMIATFRSTGEKGWIEATVVIDGATYRRSGLRLKGNSSLMGLRNANGAVNANPNAPAGGAARGGPGGSASASTPNALPWLIRLDKYVKTQDHKGTTELVVRSNSSQTSLNEAVALELLGLSGQVTQKAFATRFRVNGGDPKLRLVVENPGDEWDDANFANDGVLYKAESGGDYSYRGEDPKAYKDIFDQETDTDDENYAPLTAFLKFINQSDDATFARELGSYLEIDAFAKYLAGQELVANFDDIDGPGNNSYLRYDTTTKRITIVSWDLNLAFGSMPGGAPGFGAPPAGGPGAALPGGTSAALPGGAGAAPSGPTGAAPGGRSGPAAGAARGQVPGGAAGQGPGAGPRGRPNVLVTRFVANAEFKARYDKELAAMKAQLYGGGAAAEVLARWRSLLTSQAGDVVPAATVDQEAAAVARYFTA
jgi:spore coat protein CotH